MLPGALKRSKHEQVPGCVFNKKRGGVDVIMTRTGLHKLPPSL